jgi:ParB-like chromosome segregation protein Spo0J
MSIARQVQAKTEVATTKSARVVKEKLANAHVGSVPSLEELQAMPVHPMAAMFPMLSEEDLAELAADIAENGVNHPIVITRDGTLIDGRNRLAACALAKVEPPITYFEGSDPAAFIISENVNRRHMTKGQCAMAVAMIYPEAEAKGGRGKTSAKISEVSDRYIGMARTVLAYSRPLAQSVLAGMPLAEAYKEAKDRLDEKQSEAERQEKERAEFEANLARLRDRYPELARKVVEDGLSLKAMLVEASELDKQAKSQRQSLFMGLRTACKAMSGAGFSSSSELPNLPKYLASKEILKEFRAEFQGSPTDLVAMIPVMEQELAALKEVISKLDEGAS